ncbi:hypothetical protein BT96DRAFT_990638 [Gymnopus androsaceus JB14]|uniref:Uncharacterized protein n=1 Tax=Gymnopus androsaceus JB14 TaxID=1447944 RepID=A0A6A4I2I2_9AGAR|nr:hypothetical protein BT96DRAFT_990638 [Gymnopus androsaceus JB14]
MLSRRLVGGVSCMMVAKAMVMKLTSDPSTRSRPSMSPFLLRFIFLVLHQDLSRTLAPSSALRLILSCWTYFSEGELPESSADRTTKELLQVIPLHSPQPLSRILRALPPIFMAELAWIDVSGYEIGVTRTGTRPWAGTTPVSLNTSNANTNTNASTNANSSEPCLRLGKVGFSFVLEFRNKLEAELERSARLDTGQSDRRRIPSLELLAAHESQLWLHFAPSALRSRDRTTVEAGLEDVG